MKQYTKKEITELVKSTSKIIMEDEYKNFSKKLVESVEGKTNNEALTQILAMLYFESQKNCQNLVIEVLDKILND